jgi:hypothetical protein
MKKSLDLFLCGDNLAKGSVKYCADRRTTGSRVHSMSIKEQLKKDLTEAIRSREIAKAQSEWF